MTHWNSLQDNQLASAGPCRMSEYIQYCSGSFHDQKPANCSWKLLGTFLYHIQHNEQVRPLTWTVISPNRWLNIIYILCGNMGSISHAFWRTEQRQFTMDFSISFKNHLRIYPIFCVINGCNLHSPQTSGSWLKWQIKALEIHRAACNRSILLGQNTLMTGTFPA